MGTGKKGQFVISLDFELYWGVRDKRRLEDYAEPLRKVHELMPVMLELFREYGVKATFATVGLLFAETKDEMLASIPEKKPAYTDPTLSPYTDLGMVGEDTTVDPYHYAFQWIKLIRDRYPEHEIGSHTFSHYYCQEAGQDLASFEADLKAAAEIAKKKGLSLKSLVFPRNQYNTQYLVSCANHGILTYRGNETVWFQSPESKEATSLFKKVARTSDCYLNLSGDHIYDLHQLKQGGKPYNIPSSRFLRPYQPKGGAWLEKLKLRRIKRSMTRAAKQGKLYHLWWHPHNFGAYTKVNMATLKAILGHYRELNRKYGFESLTMEECVR